MSEFVKPKEINFSSVKELPAVELSKILYKTMGFVQSHEPNAKLKRYDDWREHDGLHFHRGKITFDEIFEIINLPENLIKSMTGDFNVFVGIAPDSNSWYLRFYLDWEEDEENLVGRFDVTFSNEFAKSFEEEVLKQLGLQMKKQNAEDYFQSIIL